MRTVFICSRYRAGEDQLKMHGVGEYEAVRFNVQEAHAFARFALAKGYCPIAPHAYFTEFLKDHIKDERDLGIKSGMHLMQYCEEMWVFDIYGISEGMQAEIDEWERNHSKPGNRRNFYSMHHAEIEVHDLRGLGLDSRLQFEDAVRIRRSGPAGENIEIKAPEEVDRAAVGKVNGARPDEVVVDEVADEVERQKARMKKWVKILHMWGNWEYYHVRSAVQCRGAEDRKVYELLMDFGQKENAVQMGKYLAMFDDSNGGMENGHWSNCDCTQNECSVRAGRKCLLGEKCGCCERPIHIDGAGGFLCAGCGDPFCYDCKDARCEDEDLCMKCTSEMIAEESQ